MPAPVLHIGDTVIQTSVEQKTFPSLHVMDDNGDVYHIAIKAQNAEMAFGTESLIYEEQTINTCQTLTLDAGIYRVELRGGAGGVSSRCSLPDSNVSQQSNINTSVFKLDEETEVYVLRGGDGNNSGACDNHQFVGGGASGVDSILVLPTRTIRSTGGVGQSCGYLISNPMAGGGQTSWGNSIGGGTSKRGGDSWYGNLGNSGGGGGGAPNGRGGAAGNNSKAGTDATADAAGDGGDTVNPNGDSKTSNTGHGGRGGANVRFQCGTDVAMGYGGGGGGGVCFYYYEPACTKLGLWCFADCIDGADGGTGSTGTSDTSYVKIYRMG